MHSYDPSRQQPYQNQIPAMRPPQEPATVRFSATPIYDALYTEYRQSFKALPGDRSGEEHAEFSGFGTGDGRDRRTESPGHGGSGYGGRPPAPFTPWNGEGRYGSRLPAALPPGPRRGL